MSSPTIDVWYGDVQRLGMIGNPSRFVNILGRVSSPVGIHAAAYQLNGGRLTPLPLGPTAFRLLANGDFNVELDRSELTVGANTVELRTVDQAGAEARRTVTVEYADDRAWPLPYRADWSAATSIQDVAQVIDGRWELTAAGLHCAEIGYDRLVAIGEMTWRDVVVTVPITIHRFTDLPAAYAWPSNGAGCGILLRWQGHSDWHDLMPRRGYLPFGAIGFYHVAADPEHRELQVYSGADGTLPAVQENRHLEPGNTYIFKMAVETQPDRPSRYSVKVWPQGAAEPCDWDVVGENPPGELATGSVVLLAHHTETTFGEVVIEPL